MVFSFSEFVLLKRVLAAVLLVLVVLCICALPVPLESRVPLIFVVLVALVVLFILLVLLIFSVLRFPWFFCCWSVSLGFS